ncbi:hypothetical protein [Ornithinimicrobium kibberense]
MTRRCGKWHRCNSDRRLAQRPRDHGADGRSPAHRAALAAGP